MNVYATEIKNFIKYENANQLFRELYNVCLLFVESNFWYCFCYKNQGKNANYVNLAKCFMMKE